MSAICASRGSTELLASLRNWVKRPFPHPLRADASPPSTLALAGLPALKAAAGRRQVLIAPPAEYLLRELTLYGWQMTNAAATIGISRENLCKHLRRVKLTVPARVLHRDADEPPAA